MNNATITVAYGDGIGPEIMQAVLAILRAADAKLEIHPVEIGEQVFLKGNPIGIEPSTWETIKQSQALLKAPITTPQGGGYKSLNVTLRTTLGLYANVRPCISYAPFIETKHPEMNLVIIRENEEDLYGGIEYRQTPDVCESLKLISRPGCEKIARFAFEYAKAAGRKKVTCFTKDNILKFTDGLFHKVFEEVAASYPEVEHEHWIVDIGAAKLADTPEKFDVIVLPNLYGDILSDVAAQIAGSVGLAGAANIGENKAMFEAIHGSAPKNRGLNKANPSALLNAAILMLDYLQQPKVAKLINNAWLKTIEEGIHTYDIFKQGTSRSLVGTKEFAQAVIDRLGKHPDQLQKNSVHTDLKTNFSFSYHSSETSKKRVLVGCDIFIYAQHSLNKLLEKLNHLPIEGLKLMLISNRGVQVWPDRCPETFCIEQWCCRFLSTNQGGAISEQQIALLLKYMADSQVDFIKIENLYTFDGSPGYSHASEGLQT